MTFRMTSEHLYWWPVSVKVPRTERDKAGKYDTMTLKLQFSAIGSDEAEALRKEIAALPEDEQAERQHDHMKKVIRDWAEVVDDDNAPIPFSMDVFMQAMQRSWFRLGVYQAYSDSISGEGARAKN